ncbi:MAG: anti-sigma factor [Gemmatimonadales bacterium]
MNDQWTNRLSDYLDGELDTNERDALEAHLATCGSCYATLAELRQVVARAKTLTDAGPETDLWPSIATRIRHEHAPAVHGRPVRRRFSFSVPQLLAACIALVLLSGGGAWMALDSRGHQSRNSARGMTPTPSEFRNAVSEKRWKVQSDMAIAELQDALTDNEGKLDTATVRIVRQNLAVIDRAIGQAQHALKRDPGNSYLNIHLANTMRQKIELLRRANALASSES